MFSSSDEMLRCPQRPTVMIERKWKSNVELAPNCPRCASSNTKFCYYNNYSLSQPRYFCKGCRRYWTKGGSLRNVPVGGGCRKNRRGKSVRLSPTTTTSEQVSMSHSHKSVLGDSCVLADGNLTHSPVGTGESDIDLSVVFAKFLNQNSSLDPELPNEIDASFNLLNHDSNSMLEFPNELIEGTSREVLGEFDQVYDHEQQQQLKIPQFMGSDLNGYGLQSLLNDNVVEDTLWSDTQAMPNFTWQQQPQQLQGGLEPVMPDDHFSFHPNLLNNNWTSFDL